MPFSLTQTPFNTWAHVRRPSDLDVLKTHPEFGIVYHLHYTKDTIIKDADSLQAILIDSFDIFSNIQDVTIPLDFIWRASYGPMQMGDIKQPHQIRLVFSMNKERAILRLLKGSQFSNHLWRIIPTSEQTGQPYSETSAEFWLIKKTLSPLNIHIQGLEQIQEAEEVGKEIKIDKLQPTLVNDWKNIIEPLNERTID